MLGRAISALLGGLSAAFVATPLAVDAPVPRTEGLSHRKAPAAATAGEPAPLLGTLFQTHTGELVLLDATSPPQARFDLLVADRVTGQSHALAPELLDLVRRLVEGVPGARVELVSGYRSPKLNELLRKKGHHVASHSQHSLGHALDFRVVPPGHPRGLAPRELERRIRALGWKGGVGTYPLSSDWFVHADVGPERRWGG